uniref:Uncharacterized protein n=1 Tax=uncultured marine bacterium EB80_69G07 TaxID=415442 RepID=A4GK07_9BACT|nr:hypothetical protein MBMO_EB80-69G07.0035 [uncultured marine bacterium EB80_69G07]
MAEAAEAAAEAADRLAVEVQEHKLVQMMVHLYLEQAILEQFQLLSQQNILKKKVNWKKQKKSI